MSEYLGEEEVRAHEARIEALSKMFEDVELQGKEMSAAMQEFDSRIFTHSFYHEAPNDVFELIFPHLSVLDENGCGKGGLNVMRLVSKRCMRVVESVATRLTGDRGADKLPISSLKRYRRIEHVRCGFLKDGGLKLKTLEGCPDGLKSLFIGDGRHLQSLEPLSACKGLEGIDIRGAKLIFDLGPLSSCTGLKKLILRQSKVTELSPLSSMLLLEELDLRGESIKDISVLSQCYKLMILTIGCNCGIKDLSPLCQCPDLEELSIYHRPLIKDLSFLEKGFTKLRVLNISGLRVEDLSPLTKLKNLEELICHEIPPTTSIAPLARCYKLKSIISCSRAAKDLGELREKRPDLQIMS